MARRVVLQGEQEVFLTGFFGGRVARDDCVSEAALQGFSTLSADLAIVLWMVDVRCRNEVRREKW